MIKEWLRNWLFPVEMNHNTEPPPCQSCELLKEQLNASNYERKILFEKVIEQAFPNLTASAIPDVDNMTPIRTNSKVPWRVRQQQLQNESRAVARQQAIARENAPRAVSVEGIGRLEEELGVNNGAVQKTVQQDEQERSGNGEGINQAS